MKTSRALLQIGASEEAIKAARAAIIDILKIPNLDNSTRCKALDVFASVCQVNGTTVTNCAFTTNEKR